MKRSFVDLERRAALLNNVIEKRAPGNKYRYSVIMKDDGYWDGFTVLCRTLAEVESYVESLEAEKVLVPECKEYAY